MRRFLQVLGVLLVLGLIYALVVGLGLTNLFKHRNTVKSLVITDFEDVNNDFDWTTGGYVKIEPSSENQTHGKYCAKATFFLPSQFFPTPTPGEEAFAPVTWEPQMVLDINSVTQLKVYEWQEYTDLKMDVFNPQDQPVTYHVQVADSHAYVYESTGSLTPKKVTNIDMPLEEFIKARVDLTNIRSLRFWVDTMGATEPVVVYLDYIRLEGDSSLPAPKPNSAAVKTKP